MKTLITALFLATCLCSCQTTAIDESKETIEDTFAVEKEKTASKDSIIINDEEAGIPEPVFVTDPKEMQILAYNDTLYKGDTLKITFKIPHSKDFAITTPDGKFFFVVYAHSEEQTPSLVDWNDFANLGVLEIVTDKTKANMGEVSVKENQLIFTRTGKYDLELGENLETDDGTPIELKTVYYIHARRKE